MKELHDPEDLAAHFSVSGRTVVMFALSTCPYCAAFKPVFDAFAKKKKEGFSFLRVFIDDYDCPLWEKYHIEVTPTVLLFEKGKIVSRLDGRPGEGLNAKDLEKI